MKQSKLIIIGAGGHGKVAASCAEAMGMFSNIAFLDSNFSSLEQVADWPVIDHSDEIANYVSKDIFFFVAIGNNQARRKVQIQINLLGGKLAILVHPRATIDKRVEIGRGSLILAGAVINILSRIGEGCIVNTGATVDHDCCLGDFVHIAPGVNLAGSITIGNGSFIGVGSAVIPNVQIGDNSIIGAGSTVLTPIPSNMVAVGTPAQIIKQNN